MGGSMNGRYIEAGTYLCIAVLGLVQVIDIACLIDIHKCTNALVICRRNVSWLEIGAHGPMKDQGNNLLCY